MKTIFPPPQRLRVELSLPFQESINVGALKEWIKCRNPSAFFHVEIVTYLSSIGSSVAGETTSSQQEYLRQVCVRIHSKALEVSLGMIVEELDQYEPESDGETLCSNNSTHSSES